jgi:hypothetical protein
MLFFVLMLKTMGDYTWCGTAVWCNDLSDYFSNASSILSRNHSNPAGSSSILKSLETEHFNFTASHNIMSKIMTPVVWRSLIGYFTFWTSTIWFTISCFGLLYYQYIDRSIVLEQ